MDTCNVKSENFLFDWQKGLGDKSPEDERSKKQIRGSKKSADKKPKVLNIQISSLSPQAATV
jgi:hypothetical protein